ncbi:MAG: NADPH:quinone reductase [Alphaproteobacteria bacterium]|nr:NADPH:quinone reductase [Alphaproteobacteria bacterium]
MTKAIRFEKIGGPEVLELQDINLPAPGPGEVRVRHTAVGVNFIDIYHRTGLYKLKLPTGLGLEAAGVVEAVGPEVTRVAVGDRVAYASGPVGAYSEASNVPQTRLVKLPEGVSDDIAAASLLKGMTAHYLLRRTHPVKAGESILIHAGAGGVGMIAVQWAKSLGAVVIATVGNHQKIPFVQRLGAAHVIVSQTENIATRVREITGGKGVSVVYDSVGRDTFMASIDSLAPLGLLVSFGNASGPVPPIEPQLLSQKGSLFFTRPTLASYVSTPEELDTAAGELFALISSGTIRVRPPQKFPLSQAADAHRAIESRQTKGSLVLIPD